MGGLIVFVAIAVPYLVLWDRGTPRASRSSASPWGRAALGFADDYIKVTKRRSLGLPARWKLLVQIGLALALWWVATDQVGLDPRLEVRVFDAQIYLGPVLYVLFVFLVIAGASNARQPDRRARRAGGGLLRDRPARLHGDHDHERPGGPGAAVRLPGRRLGRLPLVQLVPGGDLHGRHRLAGARARRSARWR